MHALQHTHTHTQVRVSYWNGQLARLEGQVLVRHLLRGLAHHPVRPLLVDVHHHVTTTDASTMTTITNTVLVHVPHTVPVAG
jgi:hypothetical protein